MTTTSRSARTGPVARPRRRPPSTPRPTRRCAGASSSRGRVARARSAAADDHAARGHARSRRSSSRLIAMVIDLFVLIVLLFGVQAVRRRSAASRAGTRRSTRQLTSHHRRSARQRQERDRHAEGQGRRLRQEGGRSREGQGRQRGVTAEDRRRRQEGVRRHERRDRATCRRSSRRPASSCSTASCSLCLAYLVDPERAHRPDARQAPPAAPRRPRRRLAARLARRAHPLRPARPRGHAALLFPILGVLGVAVVVLRRVELDAQPEPAGSAGPLREDRRRRRPRTLKHPRPTSRRTSDGRRNTSTPSKRAAQEQKFLLGGKGANLAEMTNLGLPVPPGFTIRTEACNAYMAVGDQLPRRPDGRGRRRARGARAEDGQAARRRRRSAARVGALGCAVLDARDDGHGPQPRAQRRVGEGPREADEQRALRVRLVPPLRADVRQDRARRPRRPVRGGAARPRRGEGLSRRHRADAPTTSPVSSRRSRGSCTTEAGVDFPTDPHGAAPLRDRSRVQVVERPPRARLPPDREASPTTSAPRSTCRRWCSATRATTPAPASRSRATRRPARTSRTATS